MVGVYVMWWLLGLLMAVGKRETRTIIGREEDGRRLTVSLGSMEMGVGGCRTSPRDVQTRGFCVLQWSC